MYNELEMIRRKVFSAHFMVLPWHVSAQPALHQNSNLVSPEHETGELTTTMWHFVLEIFSLRFHRIYLNAKDNNFHIHDNLAVQNLN